MASSQTLLEFQDRTAWRKWLEVHHASKDEAWLILYKKGVCEGSLSLDEAVQEALCFGWIDGKLISINEDCFSLRFSPRKSNSVWSISNIRRVERLIKEGLMTEAGMQKVAEARKSGQWDAAIAREQTDEIPSDLEKALRRKKGAIAAYRNLPDSRKKMLLHWLMTSKHDETRKKRVDAILTEVASSKDIIG